MEKEKEVGNPNPLKVGISIGDINGIGPEVIMKTFSDSRMLLDCMPIIYGSTKVFSQYKKVLNEQEFNYQSCKLAEEAQLRKINVVNVWSEDVEIQLGQVTELGGKLAFLALERATQDQALMVMVDGHLRVALATVHVPLKEVHSTLTKSLIADKLKAFETSLKKDFGVVRPKIAVLGLNPHAGENGKMGTEEQEIITPAINQVKQDGMLAFGPYPADGFFGSETRNQFDGVLAMYHDQGLAAFKALAFNDGVNYTAGLPIVRTSPDHGTAFDIAGKGKASANSMRQAIYTAMDIYRSRINYRELTSNPLQSQVKEKDKRRGSGEIE